MKKRILFITVVVLVIVSAAHAYNRPGKPMHITRGDRHCKIRMQSTVSVSLQVYEKYPPGKKWRCSPPAGVDWRDLPLLGNVTYQCRGDGGAPNFSFTLSKPYSGAQAMNVCRIAFDEPACR